MAQSFKSSARAFTVNDSGLVQTNVLFQADLVGYFSLKVEVYETTNKNFNDQAEIKIYIVSNEQSVQLVFSKLPNQVEAVIDDLADKLSKFLDLKVTVGAIKTHMKSDESPDATKTDAFIYASEKDSEGFLSAADLQEKLDKSYQARNLLLRYGVQKAQLLSTTEEEDEDETLKRLFVILVTIMSIIVVALILVLIKIIRMYRRRLKAATTTAFASPKQQEMYEHPGTNKYYTAENPLFGKEIKAPDLEEDRKSTNSLDINEVDPKAQLKTMYEQADPEEEQEVVLQIMDSGVSSPQHDYYSNQNIRLNKVLEEYDSSVHTKTKPPPPMPHMNGVGHNNHSSLQLKGHMIPGLGQDVQEAVTRFSDGGRLKDSGYPEIIHEISTEHGNLEYTDI